jgi:starvation-inducible DNA-binding protein
MLIDSLKAAQADAFVLGLKSQFYHWNVEGPDFVQYHDFLGEYYSDVQGSVDVLAELLRTLDAYAPGTTSRLKELSSIEESDTIPDALTMLKNIKRENDKMLVTLIKAYDAAEKDSQFGVSNYLQDRIQAHEKHGWMLRALTK